MAKRTQLIIQFKSREDAAKWFIDVKAAGGFPPNAHLFKPDALDLNAKRASVGDLIVRNEGESLGEKVV